jgi:hypothetical protein
LPAPGRLGARAVSLVGDAALHRGAGRPRGTSRARGLEGGCHEGAYPFAGILEVPALVARSLAHDEEQSLSVEPVAARLEEPGARGLVETFDETEVDA